MFGERPNSKFKEILVFPYEQTDTYKSRPDETNSRVATFRNFAEAPKIHWRSD
jgi:hypothetical protein